MGAILELERTNAEERDRGRGTRTYQPKAPTSTQPKQRKNNMDNKVVYELHAFILYC
jgi:hypothetical protein